MSAIGDRRWRSIFSVLEKSASLWLTVVSLLLIATAQGDQWVTAAKKNTPGRKLLGVAVYVIQVRSDGTVSSVHPAAGNAAPRYVWRAAKSVKRLTFRPGEQRTIKIPVTLFLE